MQATAPSFTGPQPVNVGGKVFGAPRGSKLAHAAAGAMVYLLLPDNSLHALTARGEVTVPRVLIEPLRRRYFGTA